MTDKRVIVLSEFDSVLFADSSDEAVRALFVRAYRLAQDRVKAAGPDRIDAEGEIHPRRWRLVFGEDNEDITTKQRGFLHAAVFPQIAEQAVVNGVGATAKAWKDWYREQFLGWKWIKVEVIGERTKTGKPRFKRLKVRVSTEDLQSPKAYAEYIDRVIAHATTTFGVAFEFDERERESVRYQPRKRHKQVTLDAAEPHNLTEK